MDFIKGNEQVKIDPNGIDISGAGNIFINSNSVTGDISFNDKVSISNNFDVTGDFNINGNINISGNNNFVITNDGNVGIGTSIPNSKLEIEGTNTGIRFTDNRSNYGEAGNVEMGKIEWYSKEISLPNDYDPMCKISAISVDNGGVGGVAPDCRISFFSGVDGVIDEKMSIHPNGNVGIATTNPGERLHIYGEGDKGRLKIESPDNNPVINLLAGTNNIYMFNDNSTGTFTIRNASSGNKDIVMDSNGYVGIATTNPTTPLDIRSESGSFTAAGNWHQWLFDNGDTITRRYYGGGTRAPWTESNGVSLHAIGRIYAENGFLAASDSRIKTDISNVKDETALQQVNALESKEYHYIDPMRKRPIKTIGFIAQEVQEVIPNAVSLQTQYVPDEMRVITDPQWTEDDGKYYLNIPDLDMSGAFTGKGKFYVSNDSSGNDVVCKEVEIKKVLTEDSTPLFPKAKLVAEFDQSWNNVFFYGKEVSDFHTIDKAQIFALHHSAIQELSRKNDEKTEKIIALENKVNNITVTNAVLKSTNENLKNRLEALEASVLSLQNN